MTNTTATAASKTTASKASKTTATAGAAMTTALASKASKASEGYLPTPATLSAAVKALGMTSLTFDAGREAERESKVRRAVAAVIAYAHVNGLEGTEKVSKADAAKAMGVSAGQMTALVAAGEIIAAAGKYAADIAADAVTWCQGSNADARKAALQNLKAGTKVYADAVSKGAKQALAGARAKQATSKGATTSEGKPEGSTLDVSKAALAKVFSETAARLAKIEDPTKWNAETVAAWDALAAQVARIDAARKA